MRSFCRKNHVRKIPLFWGGGFWGGGSADFIFMGARIFLRGATLTENLPRAARLIQADYYGLYQQLQKGVFGKGVIA